MAHKMRERSWIRLKPQILVKHPSRKLRTLTNSASCPTAIPGAMWFPHGPFANPWSQMGVQMIGGFPGGVEALRALQWPTTQVTQSIGATTGNMPAFGFPGWPTSSMGTIMNSPMPWTPGYYWPWMLPACMPFTPGMNLAPPMVEGTSSPVVDSHQTQKPQTGNVGLDKQHGGFTKDSSKKS